MSRPNKSGVRPPRGTKTGTHHLLTYEGADAPSVFLWGDEFWSKPGTGWGTKASHMAVLGWRYVGPEPAPTPAAPVPAPRPE